MQRYEYPLQADSLSFDAELYLPQGADLSESGSVIRSFKCLENGMALLRLSSSASGLFAFLGLVQELPGGSRNDNLAEPLLDCLDEDSGASIGRLNRFIFDHNQSLKCLILEVKPQDQADPEWLGDP